MKVTVTSDPAPLAGFLAAAGAAHPGRLASAVAVAMSACLSPATAGLPDRLVGSAASASARSDPPIVRVSRPRSGRLPRHAQGRCLTGSRGRQTVRVDAHSGIR
jgi:hypothetical protein